MDSPDSDWPALTGNQEPLHLLADPGDTSEADKVIALARRLGCPLMPWQRSLLRGMLATRPDGRLVHPASCAVATRQSGKTHAAADLLIIYWLFMANGGDGGRVLYSSQRWKTSENTYFRVLKLIESQASLARRVTRKLNSAGQAAIWVSSGARVEFVTRSLDSGRGLDRIDALLMDEGFSIRPGDLAAMAPTQLAAANPMTVYLSSAANELLHANALVLTGLRQRALDAIAAGRTGTGLFYAEYAAPEPPQDCSEAQRRALREDPEVWRQASPSYGIIQNADNLKSLLVQLDPVSFECECLGWGRWPALSDAADRAVDPDDWHRLAADGTVKLAAPGPLTVAVDLSPASRVWSIAQAQHTVDGRRIAVELAWADAKASVTDVCDRVMHIVREFDPAAVLVPQAGASAVLRPYLTDAGIEAEMVSTADVSVAAAAFVDAITDRRVVHPAQHPLDESVLALIRKELPGERFVFTTPAGAAPACHAVAASIAHWKAVTAAPPRKPKPPPPMMTDSRDDGPSIMRMPF